jgi:carbamoyl-phosphate synthase large subunit
MVYSLEDLCFYAKRNKDLIFQPFIAGSIYTVDVLRDCSGKCVCIPRKELLRNSIGLGISIRIEKCFEIVEICTSIMNHLHIYGIANIEFIRHDEQFYFLEINPRFSGGVVLVF